MPSSIANVTKSTFFQALSQKCGDYWPILSTSAGNAGRTTAVFTSLIGQQASAVVHHYLWQIGVTNTGEFRFITQFDPLTGTITVNRAFTTQTATAEASELHRIRPDLLTLAGNDAIYATRDMVYREVDGFIIPNGRAMYGFPRGMRNYSRAVLLGSQVAKDLFDRADSATSAGTPWVASAGTLGISGERLYFPDDADGDFATLDVDLRGGGYIRTVIRSDTTASHYRCPAAAFYIREDYLAAVDLTTCLRVRLLNGAVDLVKRDAGTDSTLATSTQTVTEAVDYQVEILWAGSRIRVWLDSVEVISYELLGTSLKYLDYPRAGIRFERAGTPTVTARVDSFYAYSLNQTSIIMDAEPQADSLMIRLPARGNKVYTSDDALWVQGQGRLTQMAADTTFETISFLSTAVLEIQTGDPGYQLLLDYARFILYEHKAQPGNTADADEREEYRKQAEIAKAMIDNGLEMPQPAAHFSYPR